MQYSNLGPNALVTVVKHRPVIFAHYRECDNLSLSPSDIGDHEHNIYIASLMHEQFGCPRNDVNLERT